ncbi:MAG: excinuclease ABC subunit UvrA [Rikenellaceae bacterium]|nr:excinuclease ABC subunit UvrA [Rikenellaceae bacterium]
MKENQKHPYIHIKGARVHNLKNIELKIPHNELVVITGLSGSGKSTLAFDTIFAEGQRRYVESLSAYARQFLGKINKPDVDFITGIAPAIAIEQKVNTRNPRSTVGTSTEIYDYLKLLYARIGHTYSPVSGKEVRSHSLDDVVDFIISLGNGKRFWILSPLNLREGQGIIEKLTLLVKDGFQRLMVDGETVFIEDYLTENKFPDAAGINILIDRGTVADNEEERSRIADSVQAAFNYSNGECLVGFNDCEDRIQYEYFNNRFEADGILFDEPSEQMFSFNNPIGACPRCEGYGKVIGIDEDLVVPDKSKTVYDDAIACWRGNTMKWWKEQLVMNSSKFNFPVHKPFYDLTTEQKQLLWRGNEYFQGLDNFFEFLESEKYKIQFRVMLSRYSGKTLCPDCGGQRLKPEALNVKIGGKNIAELVSMSVKELHGFFSELELSIYDQNVGERILTEIKNRLQYLLDVGLGYLTMNRLSSTLSGGESQRINLSTSLGSSLVGSMYILDEPSIGLHPRDTHRLIKVLKQLRDLGNTVIVVEHEEEIIRAADTVIDVGPEAGYKGGEIVFNGSFDELINSDISLTAKYLTGRESIKKHSHVRKWSNYIGVKGARENNLKGVDVKIPLGVMTCITGVSGSGKSSLVKGILYPALRRELYEVGLKPGNFEKLFGDLNMIKHVEMVDQNPIGKSSRSNPVTYIKAYDEIRKLLADQQYAKMNGYGPSHFSFNIAGGRCEECQGEGFTKVEMQFMADVELACDACGGKRFKDDILEVKYRGKSIYDILEMTIDSAVDFFREDKNSGAAKRVVDKLKLLQDVGLGYIKLGQSSSTLSGGENQRVKLASFLVKDANPEPIMFIFDEPTTGLHFHDIKKLLKSFDALIEKEHTIVIVEHNMDVIKNADWIIDLGPEGGEEGGTLIFEGLPDEIKNCEKSYTGRFLKANDDIKNEYI